MVVLLDRMSTSPDCSAVKRCWAVSAWYFTLSASPKIAAATARQTSTSRPTHLPWLSASAKPAVPVGTPQISAPRALTASRSLPAMAPVEVKTAARAAAVASETLCIVRLPFVALGQVSPCRGKQATGQMKAATLLERRWRLRSPPARGERNMRDVKDDQYQRIGGAYCRPPWVHRAFWPRAILSGEPAPTLRSNISP